MLAGFVVLAVCLACAFVWFYVCFGFGFGVLVGCLSLVLLAFPGWLA